MLWTIVRGHTIMINDVINDEILENDTVFHIVKCFTLLNNLPNLGNLRESNSSAVRRWSVAC